MFSPGDLIEDTKTGHQARFEYTFTATWPEILAVAKWPDGAEVLPGHLGVPYARCRLVKRKEET